MIKVYNQVPHIYYNESRDFQVFGRLYEVLFNYIKSNVDLIYNLPTGYYSDKKLIQLLAKTLGFQSKHEYITKDLQNLLSIFSYILKRKGTLEALEIVSTLLLTSQNLLGTATVLLKEDPVTDKQLYEVEIIFPEVVQDLELLDDVFNYILPAGYLFSINVAKSKELESKVGQGNIAKLTEYSTRNLTSSIHLQGDPRMPDTPSKLLVDKDDNITEFPETQDNQHQYKGQISLPFPYRDSEED